MNNDLTQLMRPFPPQALGWFCLGYHMSDALGRAAVIQRFLSRSGVPSGACTTANVQIVLTRLLQQCPQWIVLQPSSLSWRHARAEGGVRGLCCGPLRMWLAAPAMAAAPGDVPHPGPRSC